MKKRFLSTLLSLCMIAFVTFAVTDMTASSGGTDVGPPHAQQR